MSFNTKPNRTPENPSKKQDEKKKNPLQSTTKKVGDKVHSILERKK